MMKPDPDRLLAGAKAIAAVYGDAWESLDAEARKHYLAEARAASEAFAAHDTKRRGTAIAAGHARTRRVGLRANGRPRIAADAEARARQMILDKKPHRLIRELTGLGNSTITRIKVEIAEKLDASPIAATARHSVANAP